MAYGFNDDKSKFNFGDWARLIHKTSGKMRGDIYYKVTDDGEVTLKFNLALSSEVSAGTVETLVALNSLPTAIKPKGTSAGGLGLYMQSPMYMMSQNNKMEQNNATSAMRCAFAISKSGLAIRLFDAITSTMMMANDFYIHSEWKYNTGI